MRVRGRVTSLAWCALWVSRENSSGRRFDSYSPVKLERKAFVQFSRPASKPPYARPTLPPKRNRERIAFRFAPWRMGYIPWAVDFLATEMSLAVQVAKLYSHFYPGLLSSARYFHGRRTTRETNCPSELSNLNFTLWLLGIPGAQNSRLINTQRNIYRDEDRSVFVIKTGHWKKTVESKENSFRHPQAPHLFKRNNFQFFQLSFELKQTKIFRGEKKISFDSNDFFLVSPTFSIFRRQKRVL